MIGDHQRPRARLWMLLVCLVLAGTGCAQPNSGHLQRAAWDVGGPKRLHTKFFAFDFDALPFKGYYGVRGAALPLKENLPAWADLVEDLSITVYLADDNGAILGSAQTSYQPQKITDSGIPFEMYLNAKPPQNGRLFVSFGYRAMFVASRSPAASVPGSGNIAGQHVFFASEGAALKN